MFVRNAPEEALYSWVANRRHFSSTRCRTNGKQHWLWSGATEHMAYSPQVALFQGDVDHYLKGHREVDIIDHKGQHKSSLGPTIRTVCESKLTLLR